MDKQSDLNSGEKEGSLDKDWCCIAFSRGESDGIVDGFLPVAFLVLALLFGFLGSRGLIKSLSGGTGVALVLMCFVLAFGGAVRLLFLAAPPVPKQHAANVVSFALLLVAGWLTVFWWPQFVVNGFFLFSLVILGWALSDAVLNWRRRAPLIRIPIWGAGLLFAISLGLACFVV